MKYLILGGGISGLSAAFYLRRKYPDAAITLLEKEERLGGSIQTATNDGFTFELGPRTFLLSRSPALLTLIRDLKLENEIIYSKPGARYIWNQNRLRTLSSFLPTLFPYLIRELFLSKSTAEDESIYDFASRRFSPKIAETLFDPLALGIFAGDIRTLSIRSCFPKLFEWEQTHGSLLRGLLSSRKTKALRGLFTLQGGMSRLIEELQRQTPIDIRLGTPVEEIREHAVTAASQTFTADRIFCALPASVIGKLFSETFAARSLWVVNLLFSEPISHKSGYGYLVPSQEKDPLLGMIFDSSLFPSQNHGTLFTALVREECQDPAQAALQALQKHLQITAKPLIHTTLIGNAIPQFEVGYHKKIALFEQKIGALYPSLTLLGNYLESPSVDGCIKKSFDKIFS